MNDLSCPDCGSNIYLSANTCGMVEPIVIECSACQNRWNRFGLNLVREYGGEEPDNELPVNIQKALTERFK